MTGTGRRLLRVAAAVSWLLPLPVQAVPGAELRTQALASKAWLDDADLQSRIQDGSPATGDFNLRFMTAGSAGEWRGEWHHTLDWQGGDGVAFAALSGTGGDGLRLRPADRRLFDLSGTLDRGDRHRVTHQAERLNVQWRRGAWSVTAGRQAQSLGGGLLFHPMDFLSPFAPTTVDQDYKPGVDLFQVHRQLADGGEMALLAVGRRDADNEVTAAAASFALRLRHPFEVAEVEGLLARHRDDPTGAIGLRFPVGGALVRTDVVVSRRRQDAGRDGVAISGIVNVDHSLVLADKLVYVFAEYYHNGFGVHRLVPDRPLPDALQARVERGETHVLMRNYLGVGATLQWHPLVSQSLTLVRNLDDDSMFVQGGLQVDVSDSQNLEIGALVLCGGEGREFGGLPLTRDPTGQRVTTATGSRLYLRWTWFPRWAGFNRPDGAGP